jgi:hypothetical protein
VQKDNNNQSLNKNPRVASFAIIEKLGFRRRSTSVTNMLIHNTYFMGSTKEMLDKEGIFYLALKIQKYYDK